MALRLTALEGRILEAVKIKRNNPKRSIKELADEFEVPYTRLRARIAGRGSREGRPGANKRLSVAQEEAVCAYIDRLDYLQLAVRRSFIENAANLILNETNPPGHPPPPPVGQHWVARFIERHNYDVIPQKVLDADRQVAENKEVVAAWFKDLHNVVKEYGIADDDIWNVDETGFRIGMGKDQLVVTRRRRRVTYLGVPTNRESATAIEAVSARGDYTPAFLILSGKVHMSRWYQLQQLDGDTVIAVNDTGYSNDQLSLQWAKHFVEHSKKLRKGKYALLLLDNHGSHHTKEFIDYCWKHDVIPFGLPANITHLLQPLDVVVFQPLKHYHAQALDILVRDGIVNITKLEFLAFIQEIRRQAFKETTIRSAFRKTGIVPFDPNIVLSTIQSRRPVTPPEQILNSSSPFGTPLTIRKLNRVGERVLNALPDDLNPELGDGIQRLIRGATVQATELIQIRRDLSRTKMAEHQRQAARAAKNTQLQHGGVMTVDSARKVVASNRQDELKKAEALVKAAEAKEARQLKKWYMAAAKAGRARKKAMSHKRQLLKKLAEEAVQVVASRVDLRRNLQ